MIYLLIYTLSLIIVYRSFYVISKETGDDIVNGGVILSLLPIVNTILALIDLADRTFIREAVETAKKKENKIQVLSKNMGVNLLLNSPIKWRGGKRNLRNDIISMIPEHHCYVEPFAGGLWVLFGKDKSKVEVINDIDKNLINFYSVLKNDYNDFIEKFNTYLVSRDEFDYLKNADESQMDDLMLAYKFYYINKNSFGGDMSSFNSYYRDAPYMNESAIKLLKKAHERLKSVWVENRDYTEVIKKFDKPDSFFFFDPPYYETNNGSYKDGKNIDFNELWQQLKSIKGKFLLTINDNTYIRELMKDFNINEVEVQYNMSKDVSGRGKFGELIITNYQPERK